MFFYISVILPAACNEIESNVAHCRVCLVARRVKKKKVKITQNENILETDADVCNLLLKV